MIKEKNLSPPFQAISETRLKNQNIPVSVCDKFGLKKIYVESK